MSALDRLRALSESDAQQLHGLAMRYRRMGREYAAIAKTALTDGSAWDGAGRGSVEVYWKKLIELEHQREGIRVGRLGDLLSVVEQIHMEPNEVLEAVLRWANEHNCDASDAIMSVEAEWVRVGVVAGITKLYREVYAGDPTGRVRFMPGEAEEAQQILRGAVDLDQR